MTPPARKHQGSSAARTARASQRKPPRAKSGRGRTSARASSRAAKPDRSAAARQRESQRTFGRRMDKLVAEMVGKGILLHEAQDYLERLFLVATMERCAGNQCRAAEQLRMHRNTLRRKLDRHGLV